MAVGINHQLTVSIFPDHPDVQCGEAQELSFRRLITPYQLALNKMPVSQFEQIFGIAGQAGVQVQLPMHFPDGQLASFVTQAFVLGCSRGIAISQYRFSITA